jgi:ribosomal protein S17E
MLTAQSSGSTRASPSTSIPPAALQVSIQNAKAESLGSEPRQLAPARAFSRLFFQENIKQEADEAWDSLASASRKERLAHNNQAVAKHFAAASDKVRAQVQGFVEDQYKKELEGYQQRVQEFRNLNTESRYLLLQPLDNRE